MTWKPWCFLAVALFAIVFLAMPATAQQPTHKPGGYHSPEIKKDQSWSHVFNATGISNYHCHPHPFMRGTVEVREGASTAPVTVEITGFKFVPEKLVVGLNTNVTWINRDATFHTVDESLNAPDDGGAPAGKSPALRIPILLAGVALVATLRRRSNLT